MKRLIAMLLTLVLLMTFFVGLTISASAATDDWAVFCEHGYFDAQNATDYHVVISFRERYKTRFFFFKDFYVYQVKIDTYTSKLVDGKTAEVKKNTSILKPNAQTGLDTCGDYLKKLYPSLYSAYKDAFLEQENYRVVYIHKMSGSTASIMSKWSNYTIQRYLNKYKQYVREGFEGDVDDAIAKASGVILPEPLKVLGSASSIKGEVDKLKDLCLDVIDTLYNSIELYWLERMTDTTQLANGAPSVQDLLEEAQKYATSSETRKKKPLDTQKRVKLAPGIFTHPLG